MTTRIPLGNKEYITEKEFRKLPVDSKGWRTLPNGKRLKLGKGVVLDEVCYLGDQVDIGDKARLMHGSIIKSLVKIGASTLISNHVCVEFFTKIKGDVIIDPRAYIGMWSKIGPGTCIGTDNMIGDHATIGSKVLTCKDICLPSRCKIPSRMELTKQPLVIYGSKNPIIALSNKLVSIGDACYSVDYWLRNFKEIEKKEIYSSEQIEEYLKHLKYIKSCTNTPLGKKIKRGSDD